MEITKIAFFTLNNPFEKIRGGIESVVYNLAKALVALGCEIYVVCLGNVLQESLKKVEGVYVLNIPQGSSRWLIYKSIIFTKDGMKIIRYLEEKGVKNFVGQGGFSLPLAFYKPKRTKVFMVVHTLDEENIANIKDFGRTGNLKGWIVEIIKYFFLKLWRIFYLSKADYLIFVSHTVKDEFKRHYPFIKKKYFIIPNGAPQINLGRRICKRKYDFIYVGRLGVRKGIDILIKAIEELTTKGHNISMIFIGDGPLKSKIETDIKKLKLRNIKLLGYIKDYKIVLEYIRNTKFLILPSFYEGDPLVIKEALSLGTPCIVSNIPSLIKTIKNGKNGLIFKCGDSKDLSFQMERALNMSKKEWQEYSKNAKRYGKKTSWLKVAKIYYNIFKKDFIT